MALPKYLSRMKFSDSEITRAHDTLVSSINPLLQATLARYVVAPSKATSPGAIGEWSVATSSGVISSIVAGVVTLTEAVSATKFSVGQLVQAMFLSSDVQTARLAPGYVIATNAGAGTVTVSTTLGGGAGSPTGWAATDTIRSDLLYFCVAPGNWRRTSLSFW